MTFIQKFFDKLFCKHKWRLERERDVQTISDFGSGGRYTVYTYICTECGKFTKIKSS